MTSNPFPGLVKDIVEITPYQGATTVMGRIVNVDNDVQKGLSKSNKLLDDEAQYKENVWKAIQGTAKR